MSKVYIKYDKLLNVRGPVPAFTRNPYHPHSSYSGYLCSFGSQDRRETGKRSSWVYVETHGRVEREKGGMTMGWALTSQSFDD